MFYGKNCYHLTGSNLTIATGMTYNSTSAQQYIADSPHPPVHFLKTGELYFTTALLYNRYNVISFVFTTIHRSGGVAKNGPPLLCITVNRNRR